MSTDEMVITRAGFERLSDELERLTTDGRRAIAERLRHVTASEVNCNESADYLAVREEQALLERRIALLEQRLSVTRVVVPDSNGRIDIGERVRLRDLDSGDRFEIELVGPLEADPSGGRISVAAPLGKAIQGLRRGQIAEVDAPRGRLRFKVIAVEVPLRARTA